MPPVNRPEAAASSPAESRRVNNSERTIADRPDSQLSNRVKSPLALSRSEVSKLPSTVEVIYIYLLLEHSCGVTSCVILSLKLLYATCTGQYFHCYIRYIVWVTSKVLASV